MHAHALQLTQQAPGARQLPCIPQPCVSQYDTGKNMREFLQDQHNIGVWRVTAVPENWHWLSCSDCSDAAAPFCPKAGRLPWSDGLPPTCSC